VIRALGGQMKENIIFKLSEEDRLANHIPEDLWQLTHKHNVFIEDFQTGELISILDLCPPNQSLNSDLIQAAPDQAD